MKIRAVRWLVSLACPVAMMLAAAPADAGIIPGIWNVLFGPCGGGCGPGYCAPTQSYYAPSYCGYGGCGPSGCGVSSCGPSSCGSGGCGTVQSYYGWGNCGYSCAPCGSSCSPCTVACAPSSNCAVPPASSAAGGNSSIKPLPDDGWKNRKTYEGTESAPGATNAAPPANRTDADTGLPPNGRRTNPLNDDETKSGALRVSPPGDAAGEAKSATEEPETPAGTRKTPMPPKIPLDDKDAHRISPINLDEKIAWRPTAVRKRLEIEPGRGNARLIRIPLYAKSDWKPVGDATNVAKR